MKTLTLSLLSLAFVACGGSLPGTHGQRESGQSGLMDETFAGKNKCNPKSHERPFVIEWDATDMSSFEARATSDVVFVHYEGCELRVLDGCNRGSLRGGLGAYNPAEWTSGSVEKIDISDEGELYAKLPLGIATLGARVHAGEKFSMEYFVSGTRTATRAAVYADDLGAIPACKTATHFVYGYNLGAFALVSAKSTSGEANAGAAGVGAGVSRESTHKAEKKSGELASCRGESLKDVKTCKVPIRLMLREITPGKNPHPESEQKVPESFVQKSDAVEEARAHRYAALEKNRAHDGKGCLEELDASDKLDPRPIMQSTYGDHAWMRAECLMMAGKCDEGKRLMRVHHEAKNTPAAQAESTILAAEKALCPK